MQVMRATGAWEVAKWECCSIAQCRRESFSSAAAGLADHSLSQLPIQGTRPWEGLDLAFDASFIEAFTRSLDELKVEAGNASFIGGLCGEQETPKNQARIYTAALLGQGKGLGI